MSAQIAPLLKTASNKTPRAAIFLSGSGSNAEKVLQYLKTHAPGTPFEAAALVTDAPDTSRAYELGRLFNLPVIANDIRAFYRKHGCSRMTIATKEGWEIRQKWTLQLEEQLLTHEIDFGVFAGFVPLTNITGTFPCLNVHPGDLTYLKDGERYLVGLHTMPIERAILEGLDSLRSSVIQALPYTGEQDMDSGPILGVSEAVPIDLQGTDRDMLRDCAARRPAQRPKGGYKDRLEAVAKHNQTRLKENGDWTVLPPVVVDFAQHRFGINADGQLHYRIGRRWHPVDTVMYGKNGKELLFAGT